MFILRFHIRYPKLFLPKIRLRFLQNPAPSPRSEGTGFELQWKCIEPGTFNVFITKARKFYIS